MEPIGWHKITKQEAALIAQIADRAQEEAGYEGDTLTLFMDLSAAHLETPLDLEGLLKAEPFDFAHDIFGIYRHINRKTGKLDNCFVPRHTQK